MCVYCRAYLSYALDTMKMSLKTREKETSLTPCLKTTLWPRELIEFPEYLITSCQTIKESLRTSRGIKSYADIEMGIFLFMEMIFVDHCWASKWATGALGQEHSRQSQGNIPKASAPLFVYEGRSHGRAQRSDQSSLVSLLFLNKSTTSAHFNADFAQRVELKRCVLTWVLLGCVVFMV